LTGKKVYGIKNLALNPVLKMNEKWRKEPAKETREFKTSNLLNNY
jgi:hypothetical protein